MERMLELCLPRFTAWRARFLADAIFAIIIHVATCGNGHYADTGVNCQP